MLPLGKAYLWQTRAKPGAALRTPPSLIHSLIESSFVKISLQCRHAQRVVDGALSHKIDWVRKSQRPSKSHFWFKSYRDFAELVDFAYWWSCIGKGLRLQPAQQACSYYLS